MQATEFPIWAPRDLCALHKRETVTQSELTKCELSLLESLLTRPEMENIWKNLNDVAKTLWDSPVNVEYNFAITIIHAYRGPQGEGRLAPGAQKKRLDKIKGCAAQLAELVRDTTWDDWIFAKWRQAGWKIPKQGSIRSLNLPVSLSDFLQEFAEFAPSQMQASLLGRPNAKDACESYFKRYLSLCCQKTFKNPLTEIVTPVARLIYGGSDDDSRAMNRTRTLLKETPLDP